MNANEKAQLLIRRKYDERLDQLISNSMALEAHLQYPEAEITSQTCASAMEAIQANLNSLMGCMVAMAAIQDLAHEESKTSFRREADQRGTS